MKPHLLCLQFIRAKLLYKVKVGVSGQDVVSELAHFLVNNEAAKTDFCW